MMDTVIWVVTAQEHDNSGPAELLAAYDGERAEDRAKALVNVITRAGCYRRIVAQAVDRGED